MDVVEVDLGQHRRAPRGHRAREEVLERLQAEVEHPLRLVLELGDLLDELAGQALGRLEEVVLGVVEAEPLLVVGVDALERLLLGDRLGRGHSVDLQLDHVVLDDTGKVSTGT